jgi:hypothetical protein
MSNEIVPKVLCFLGTEADYKELLRNNPNLKAPTAGQVLDHVRSMPRLDRDYVVGALAQPMVTHERRTQAIVRQATLPSEKKGPKAKPKDKAQAGPPSKKDGNSGKPEKPKPTPRSAGPLASAKKRVEDAKAALKAATDTLPDEARKEIINNFKGDGRQEDDTLLRKYISKHSDRMDYMEKFLAKQEAFDAFKSEQRRLNNEKALGEASGSKNAGASGQPKMG